MTTLTPARDAVLRAMERMEADVDGQVARREVPEIMGTAVKRIVRASMMQLADHLDRRVKVADSLASFEMAFANAIASVVRTICNAYRGDIESTLRVFTEEVAASARRIGTSPAQMVSETTEPVRVGNA